MTQIALLGEMRVGEMSITSRNTQNSPEGIAQGIIEYCFVLFIDESPSVGMLSWLVIAQCLANTLAECVLS